jgi:hypothetical protein
MKLRKELRGKRISRFLLILPNRMAIFLERKKWLNSGK